MTQATREELDAAIPSICAAPKDGAAIEMLCTRPAYNQRCFVEHLELTPDGGIPGERWSTAPWLRTNSGAPHPGIQVSILQKRVLDLVWRDRENTVHPGDTFIVDMDLSEANLPIGQRLRVGEALLEVSDVFNTGCVKWKARYGTAARDWITRCGHPALRLRGVLCSIVEAGTIHNGDRLYKVGQSET